MEAKNLEIESLSGKAIIISIRDYCGRATIWASIPALPTDGNAILGSYQGNPALIISGLPRTCTAPIAANDASIILEALRECQAEIDASPAARLEAAIEQRENLCREISCLYDQAAEDHQRAIEAAGMGRQYAPPADQSRQIAALKAQLAALDIAHPEAIAKIKAERAESINRNNWH